MITYQYRCAECNEQFQIRKPMAEIDNTTVCPKCGSSHTARMISNVAFFSISDGVRRPVAGVPSCAGCSAVGTGCASCRPR